MATPQSYQPTGALRNPPHSCSQASTNPSFSYFIDCLLLCTAFTFIIYLFDTQELQKHPLLFTMDGLSVATGVMAVVDLSVKVTTLCVKYANEVKNASTEMKLLREEVANLQNITQRIQGLLKTTNAAKLESSQSLKKALDHSTSRLEEMDRRLGQGLKRKDGHWLKRKLHLRALKWPFQREEAQQMIHEFRQSNHTISLALQVDQV